MLRKRFQKRPLTASVEQDRRMLAIVLLYWTVYKRGRTRE